MKVIRFGVGSIYLTQKVALRDKSVVSTGFSVAGQLCLFLSLPYLELAPSWGD
jgi:hypothetical protein